jgi:hypothetical protein
MKFTLDWFKAAAIRMLRTAAQVALGMITVGMTVSEVDWLNVLSVSLVAAVYSLLTSIITDLPETGNDGTVYIQPSGEVTGIDLELTGDDILKKGRVNLLVGAHEKQE